jgi:AcrR family transcriptional regulator
MPSRPARPARRTRLVSDDRRAQLLRLGLDAFSVRPYDEVAVDDIARAAGVSKGLLYHYFPSKRDLYVAGLREAALQLIDETLAAAGTAGEPLDRVRGSLDAYLGYCARHGAAYTTLFHGGIGADAEVRRILEEVRARFLGKMLEDLPVPASPLLHAALRGWIGFVEVATLDWLEQGALSQPRLRELLAEVLLSTVQIASR